MTPDLVSHLQVIRPDGPGPFPVVVQMHGCGGVQPMQRRYAEAAREAGVAAVILDSLAPRGIGRRQAMATVCTGLRLRGAERAGDLISILDWLDDQPWADRDRRAVAGWSHGGWSVMEAMAARAPHPAMSRVRLAVLIYPYAGPLSRTARHGWGPHRPRVMACIAGWDAVVGVRAPQRAMERLKQDGLDVFLLHLPDATHAFDDDDTKDPRMKYRSDYEALVRAHYANALKAALA